MSAKQKRWWWSSPTSRGSLLHQSQPEFSTWAPPLTVLQHWGDPREKPEETVPPREAQFLRSKSEHSQDVLLLLHKKHHHHLLHRQLVSPNQAKDTNHLQKTVNAPSKVTGIPLRSLLTVYEQLTYRLAGCILQEALHAVLSLSGFYQSAGFVAPHAEWRKAAFQKLRCSSTQKIHNALLVAYWHMSECPLPFIFIYFSGSIVYLPGFSIWALLRDTHVRIKPDACMFW